MYLLQVSATLLLMAQRPCEWVIRRGISHFYTKYTMPIKLFNRVNREKKLIAMMRLICSFSSYQRCVIEPFLLMRALHALGLSLEVAIDITS